MAISVQIRIPVVALVAVLVTGCHREKPTLGAEELSPLLDSQLRAFFALKHQQAVSLVEVDKALYADSDDKPLSITKGLAPEVWPYFKAGEKGDWQKMAKFYRQMATRSYQFENPTQSPDERLNSTAWQPINETFRAFEQLTAADPKYLLAYGQEIMASVPQGSVFFAGTDAGRFLTTFLSRSQPDGDPFFIISQNQLADGLQLEYLRSMYSNRLQTPTSDDTQAAFLEFMEDLRQRFEQKKLKPGEDAQIVDGRLKASGLLAVMQINELIAKRIFHKNPDHEFYLDEQWPMEWTHAHLVPHGFVFKVSREPLARLSSEIIEKDRAFWNGWTSKAVGNWLTNSTSVQEICDFAEKTYVRKDLTEFTGDPQFVCTSRNWKPVRDYLGASAVFSKSRTSIARVYWARARSAKTVEERTKLLEEADFAFRQAFALCPYQESTQQCFGAFLLEQMRFQDAILVARTIGRFGLADKSAQDWVKQVEKLAGAAAAMERTNSMGFPTPTGDSP